MGQPGTTPLTEAARFGNHQAVKILLNYGANPDAVDHWGHTPLETAKACLQQHQNLPAGNFRKQIIPCESIQTCMKMMKETSDRNRESAIAEISFKHTNKVHRLRRQRRKAM